MPQNEQTKNDLPVDARLALLDSLEKRGALSTKDLAPAKRLSQNEPSNLARMLVGLGWVSEPDMASTLADFCQLPKAVEADYPSMPVTQPQFSFRFLQHHHLVPVQSENDGLAVIMSDPSDRDAINALRFLFGKVPTIKVGLVSSIDRAMEQVYGEGDSQITDDLAAEHEASEDDIEHLKDLASEAPIIQLVNKVMQKAVESGASDVHIEPFEKGLKIRYRVDGLLRSEDAPAKHSTAAVISRVKIMAKLDIAERRLPQDGRIMFRSHGKTLDVRVSTLPTVYGESVVMRILDRDSLELSFDKLGFTPDVLTEFLDVLAVPHGIILITGPTGSGKSTSLYTAVSHLNTPEVKIISVEDPVEYQIDGVNQLPVKSNIGLDFASALRAIVRQDPDIIMIGEMRDVETAKIAIQSALTGHLVLSTLHTNSAAGGITRLLDMGIANYLLISTINGILGQRLVRKLCVHCRESYQPSIEQLKLMNINMNDALELYRPKGCSKCSNNGYSGRTMLVEWLPISESLQTLIMTNAGAGVLQQRAIEDGMKTMFDDGIAKVLEGITCIDEVLRVTQQ